ncbi:MAG: hypothetical protein ABIR31_11605 [Ginsengibacter sp.]
MTFSRSILAWVVNEASLYGGPAVWNKYITEQIQLHADEFIKKYSTPHIWIY